VKLRELTEAEDIKIRTLFLEEEKVTAEMTVLGRRTKLRDIS
jgi:hypothetical protein